MSYCHSDVWLYVEGKMMSVYNPELRIHSSLTSFNLVLLHFTSMHVAMHVAMHAVITVLLL